MWLTLISCFVFGIACYYMFLPKIGKEPENPNKMLVFLAAYIAKKIIRAIAIFTIVIMTIIDYLCIQDLNLEKIMLIGACGILGIAEALPQKQAKQNR